MCEVRSGMVWDAFFPTIEGEIKQRIKKRGLIDLTPCPAQGKGKGWGYSRALGVFSRWWLA